MKDFWARWGWLGRGVWLGLLVGFWAEAANAPSQDRYKNLELFQKILHFVENNYVDPVKNEELVQGAIKGMLETLDPHSNFLTPDLLQDMKLDTSGKFGGLGIEIAMKDDVLTVLTPIEDTPAWKAGIKAEDRIVRINGESTKGMTLSEAVSKLRGKSGSSAVLRIYRQGWTQFKDVSLTRETVRVQTVKFEELEEGIGYIRLNSFNESASEEIREAIQKLEKKHKLKGLVFDLRMNPGGLLDQAVEVSSLFIDQGPIVSTIGRNVEQKEVKHARPGVARKDFSLVVLVGSSTASAAEIVAAAIQDHHRGLILGQTTFGKGSVQSVIDLGNEFGLKLTVARYYSPSGRSIQEKGIVPDIVLDEYDLRLLAKARIRREGTREKDLKSHLKNNQDTTPVPSVAQEEHKVRSDFSRQDLENLKKGKKKADEEEEMDMTPSRFTPKEDYQVGEAVKTLRSLDFFKRIQAQPQIPTGFIDRVE